MIAAWLYYVWISIVTFMAVSLPAGPWRGMAAGFLAMEIAKIGRPGLVSEMFGGGLP